MTRFWITLSQGIEFVMTSLESMRGGEIFVPKIPSMNIMDTAKAIAPECATETIGIRPGEKLHEIMITVDDALNTAEFNDRYVIQPAADWWDQESYLKESGSKRVPEDFQYSSDINPEWMTVAELKELLENEIIEL